MTEHQHFAAFVVVWCLTLAAAFVVIALLLHLVRGG
jgi:hypothetical protein